MKNYISSDVNGKGFFKKYILFLIPMLILAAISNRTNQSNSFVSTIASIVESYVYMLLWFAVFSYVIQFVTFMEKPFSFSGRMGEYAPKILKWYLLTVITLGIYSPWMVRNLADFYLERTEWDGRSGKFLSKPGTLLKYMLLTLYLPLIIITILFILYIYRKFAYDLNYEMTAFAGPMIGFIVVIFLIMIPFMYFYIVWLVNVRFGSNRVEFRRSLAETAGFLIPQLLLSLITLFIYYPAAMVKIYRYLLEGSVHLDESDNEKGGFGFDGGTGKGFGLLWGQGLLCVITIGIYVPWAMAKLTNWFLNNTFIRTGEEQLN